MPTVTRLRHTRPGWVAVELDGARWRTLPAEAVVRAGLVVGRELDRRSAGVLARERRRLAALDVAGKALARRELTRAELAERLERRGVTETTAGETLDAVARAGAQNDGRAARQRAAAMAARGWGDEAIAADLAGRGVEAEVAAEALAGLAPELERARALAAKLGPGLRTAQALARKGFAEETIVSAIAGSSEWE